MGKVDAIRRLVPGGVRKALKDLMGIGALQTRMSLLEEQISQLARDIALMKKRINILGEQNAQSQEMLYRFHASRGDAPECSSHKYKYLDIGTKDGAGMQNVAPLYMETEKSGVGIDLRDYYLHKAKEKGLNVLRMDGLNLGFRDKSFRFSLMLHFLEHLRSEDEIAEAISEARRVSRYFVHIRNPNFEYTDFLKEQGLKFGWSDWTGHPCHVTEPMLRRIFKKLGIERFSINKTSPIRDSSYPQIVSLDAPRDTITYSKEEHGEKEYVEFDPPIYATLDCWIYLL